MPSRSLTASQRQASVRGQVLKSRSDDVKLGGGYQPFSSLLDFIKIICLITGMEYQSAHVNIWPSN